MTHLQPPLSSTPGAMPGFTTSAPEAFKEDTSGRSFISEIGSEVLWLIFSLIAAMDPETDDENSSIDTLRRASQVSTFWRSVLLGASSLWGRVLNLGRTFHAPEWHAEVMRRTREAPLDILAAHRDVAEGPFVPEFVRKNWSRIRSLNVKVDPDSLQIKEFITWFGVAERTSNLIHLKIHGSPALIFTFLISISLGRFPFLQSLEIIESLNLPTPRSDASFKDFIFSSASMPGLRKIKIVSCQQVCGMLQFLCDIRPAEDCSLDFSACPFFLRNETSLTKLISLVLPKYLACFAKRSLQASEHRSQFNGFACVAFAHNYLEFVCATSSTLSFDNRFPFRFSLDDAASLVDSPWQPVASVISCFISSLFTFSLESITGLSLKIAHPIAIDKVQSGNIQKFLLRLSGVEALRETDTTTWLCLEIFQRQCPTPIFPNLSSIATDKNAFSSIREFLDLRVGMEITVDSLSVVVPDGDDVPDTDILDGIAGLTLQSYPSIFTIPSEILLRIFDLMAIMDPRSDNENPALNTLRDLSHVCIQWRRLLLGAPSVWSRALNLGYLRRLRPEWRDEIVRRAGEAEMDVLANFGEQDDPFDSDFVSMHWHRIRSLNYTDSTGYIDPGLYQTWSDIVQQPSTRLAHLSIFCSKKTLFDFLKSIGLTRFPNLQSLKVTQYLCVHDADYVFDKLSFGVVSLPRLASIDISSTSTSITDVVIQLLDSIKPATDCILSLSISLSFRNAKAPTIYKIPSIFRKFSQTAQTAAQAHFSSRFNRGLDMCPVMRFIEDFVVASVPIAPTSFGPGQMSSLSFVLTNVDHTNSHPRHESQFHQLVLPGMISCLHFFLAHCNKLELELEAPQFFSSPVNLALESLFSTLSSVEDLTINNDGLAHLTALQSRRSLSSETMIMPSLQTIRTFAQPGLPFLKRYLELRKTMGTRMESYTVEFFSAYSEEIDLGALEKLTGLKVKMTKMMPDLRSEEVTVVIQPEEASGTAIECASKSALVSPPISKIPPEILWHIFSFSSVMGIGDNFAPALETLRNISHVCALWRGILSSAPTIWGQALNLTYLVRLRPQWQEEITRRAGKAELHVLAIMSEGSPFIEDFVGKHWHRIRSMSFTDSSITGPYRVWSHIAQRPSNQLLHLVFHGSQQTILDFLEAIALERFPYLQSLYIFQDSRKHVTKDYSFSSAALPYLRAIEISTSSSSIAGDVLQFLDIIHPAEDCILNLCSVIPFRNEPSSITDKVACVLQKYIQFVSMAREVPSFSNPSTGYFKLLFRKDCIKVSIPVARRPSEKKLSFRFILRGAGYLDHRLPESDFHRIIISEMISCIRSLPLNDVNNLLLKLEGRKSFSKTVNSAVEDLLLTFTSVTNLIMDSRTLRYLATLQPKSPTILFPLLKTACISDKADFEAFRRLLASRKKKGSTRSSFKLKYEVLMDSDVNSELSVLVIR
ncbi:hypothetical protein CVT26_005532 [Gymnopilus dilepis]|uniref:F-box domain-containing protein n=1 Tax=Gymnopilus dilepis TaxID=231916 RepID=A0A409W819_9AGAR|nr:hypothetical protein CVT26_005532 [Gymnopilus dilepis]